MLAVENPGLVPVTNTKINEVEQSVTDEANRGSLSDGWSYRRGHPGHTFYACRTVKISERCLLIVKLL